MIFRFPHNDPVRLQLWKLICRDGYIPNNRSRICGKHFPESSMFSQSKKRFKKLNPDAIPIAIPNTHPEEDIDTNLSGLPLEPLDFLDVEYLGKHTGT